MQRTGVGPLTRQVLVIDSELAEKTSVASRSVYALIVELQARRVAIVEAYSYEDGYAAAVAEAGFHCILLNWTSGSNDSESHEEAASLLRSIRARDAKIP